MRYTIEFSEDAERHLEDFSVREQRILLDGIEASLSGEPCTKSKNRKLLRPNPLASWELRVGTFRIF